MVPSRDGGMQQSPSSSGVFFQGDDPSHFAGNSNFSSNFGNSANSLPGYARGNINIGPISGDISNTILNSVASSGPSIGASSLVTDANSALSGGPHLQRSASINTESYTRLPASPMSFSSNNITLSGSSVMDGTSVVQQNSNQDQGYLGASSATSLLHMGQVQLPPGGLRVPTSIQDVSTLSQLQKKPRMDIKQEDIVQQQALQQLLQRQDSMHLNSQNSQMQALIQQQRLRQQEQQILQAMPSMQRVQLLQQQQQQQQMNLRQQLQLQGMPPAPAPAPALRRPYDSGVCSRRLMQYLYHQRQRPSENAITYWRKFVYEYYSPRAKKRWCLSRYDNVGHQSTGVFPQSSVDAWQCDVCGSKSGRGFEATVEVLPRLNEIKFSSGVIDELLYLDLPRECRFPSGMMMLEYVKAVQETIYEPLRVVREGQLRILFTPDLKILSWQFCAFRHEELLPRRLVAPQVNQLLQVAQKCQSMVSENGGDGASQQDLQTNSALFVTAGRQLARTLELQSLNDLGFSKRYVRCLQISDVVNSMKDLMDFCKEHKKGPIEGLKDFPRCPNTPKAPTMQKMQGVDQIDRHHGMATDSGTVNKLMTLQQHSADQLYSQHINGRENLSGSAQATLALTNFQNLLMRPNSFSSTRNEALSGTPTRQNISISGFSGPQVQSSQGLQQQMIQQFLQDMSKKSNVAAQSPASNPGGGKTSSGLQNSPATTSAGAATEPPSRSNSFKVAASSNSESPAPVGFVQKEFDMIEDMMIPDTGHDFSDIEFFSNELDDDMNFSWKA